MIPVDRATFKQYCLRSLGFPVIEINVDDDQIEDRIDEALLQFQTFAADGKELWYTSHQVTANDVSNKYIQMPANTIGVTRIFTISGSQTNSAGAGGFNMFDINYQIRLNELYDYTSGDYVYFQLANEHLRMLEILFTGESPIRYNRYNNILYIDVIWETRFIIGQYLIVEGYKQLDSSAAFWGDPWLLRYGTALIKRQWGNNLSKFKSMILPGGMILNGEQIKQEALAEVEELKKELREQYEDPPLWQMG
jgi:hypothetical protein